MTKNKRVFKDAISIAQRIVKFSKTSNINKTMLGCIV
jgi:hypothetical protein